MNRWPSWAQGIYLVRAPVDVGVGDTLARYIRRFGLARFAALVAAIELPCKKCSIQQSKLNRLYPYEAQPPR